MNASEIKDLHYESFLKNLPKLNEPLGSWHLKEKIARAFIPLLIYYMTEKIAKTHALFALQYKTVFFSTTSDIFLSRFLAYVFLLIFNRFFQNVISV